jgi:uncharacterized tellurite resistance protein B-like protein
VALGQGDTSRGAGPLLLNGSNGEEPAVTLMPIIGVIVLTLSFWAIFWFVRMGGIDHLRARSAHRAEESRRAQAREAGRDAPLRAVNDPRDAATILMLLLARIDRDPTREQIAFIESTVRATFGFDGELTDHMTQARFIASRTENFAQATRVFSALLSERLTHNERLELVDMLKGVARFEGPSEAQTEALALLRPRIGLSSSA